MRMSRRKKIERFDFKYGDLGGFAKFKEMVENLCTLEEIGQHFGFSRQNTAGLYRSFFGSGYGKVQHMRKDRTRVDLYRNVDELAELREKFAAHGKVRSCRKIDNIIMVKRICEELNYKVQIERKRSGSLELYINDYHCSIAGTETQTVYHIPRDLPPSVYYRFAIPLKETDFCIFIIEHEEQNTYHIIPFNLIQHLTLITLKDSYGQPKGKRGNSSSKYAVFLNRWDLLAFPKPQRDK